MDAFTSAPVAADGQAASVDTANDQPLLMENENSINVFVTGFGPFPDGNGGHFDINSSHEVTKLLPSTIAANTAANPTSTTINLLNPTAGKGKYVPTSYRYIRNYVKHLHTFGYPPENAGTDVEMQTGIDPPSSNPARPSHPKIDMVVHIGQAAGWGFVSIERAAYGQGMSSSWLSRSASNFDIGYYYKVPDEIGETVADCGEDPWTRVPMGLQPAFNVDEVQKGAEARLNVMHDTATQAAKGKKHLPVLAHNEGGSYCCGYTFYESLANCFVLKKEADVLFCHVPGETDRESLEAARDCILAVIGSATARLLEKRMLKGI